MATTESKPEIGIGIYVRRDNILGEVIHVVPMQWDAREGRPVGVYSLEYQRPELQDLDFGGYVSDYMSADSANEVAWPYYHGSEPEYQNAHRIGARRAKAMADFLARCDRAMRKADASEPGDRFLVFAKAIGAARVWVAKGPDHADIRHPVTYTVAEGRNVYRRLITEARARMRSRLLPNETAPVGWAAIEADASA